MALVLEHGTEISFTAIAGDYVFEVSVSDPYGSSASDIGTATINIATNYAPVANAGEDQEIQVPHDGDQETDTAE